MKSQVNPWSWQLNKKGSEGTKENSFEQQYRKNNKSSFIRL